MSNTDVPAGGPGGNTETPTIEQRLPDDLPAKVRVHALAKLLGLTSKDVLAALVEVGSPAKSAQSSVDREVAVQVAAHLLPEPPGRADFDAADPDAISDVGLSTPLAPVFAQPLFMPPQPVAAPAKQAKPQVKKAHPVKADVFEADADADEADEVTDGQADDELDDDAGGSRRRRRRGRRGRGRGKGTADDLDDEEAADSPDEADATSTDQADDRSDDQASDDDDDDAVGTRRRRRRRRRKGIGDEEAQREDDPPNTVVHFRDSRPAGKATEQDDGVQGVKGSTRLEAKRQRRRDGREAGRRRAPILSEAEFLARRESVDRTMIVREHGGSSVQIGVLEDSVLVEHFVTSAGSGSLVGNVYLGRVQNVLPSMEAAFVDIGRGRNAVLYAGEVDWDAAGLEGKARKIEQALNTGDSVLVQVTKDPVGHKGARLTTQISLPGRFLVYVPGGGATGISRKLPDTERRRLKDILKRIVPEDAGVIIRTASEGVSEDSLGRDVRRLQAQWEVIKTKSDAASSGRSNAPQLLYEEPDLLIKVVRDLFTEDFSTLVVQGPDAWDTIDAYIQHVAPDLASRLRRHVGPADVFTEFRIDEQITKALDRKVWLPSGGYLVIDRTEAMTVIDVNTGKFTGAGGNLEETVTRNNLEAAEEIVRQLRLRDIGGIIVIDFIDMVLESNRDLVLRRLTECLGRDRTRHQVAEVTSLGLVQMTRKRVGTGLIEAYSQPCEHCRGRGLIVTTEPVERPAVAAPEPTTSRRSRSRKTADPKPDTKPDTKPDVKADSKPDVKAEPDTKAEPEVAAKAEPDTAPAPTTRSRRSRAKAAAAAEPEAAPAAESPQPEPEPAPAKATRTRSRRRRADATDSPPEPTADAAVESSSDSTVDDTALAATNGDPDQATGARRTRRRRAASRPAGPPTHGDVSQAG